MNDEFEPMTELSQFDATADWQPPLFVDELPPPHELLNLECVGDKNTCEHIIRFGSDNQCTCGRKNNKKLSSSYRSLDEVDDIPSVMNPEMT